MIIFFKNYEKYKKISLLRTRDVEAEAVEAVLFLWKRSFFCGSGSRSVKNPPLPLPHRREEWREKKIGSAILRRRTNRGSINIKK